MLVGIPETAMERTSMFWFLIIFNSRQLMYVLIVVFVAHRTVVFNADESLTI